MTLATNVVAPTPLTGAPIAPGTWREPGYTGSKAFSLVTYAVALLPLSVGSVLTDALRNGAEIPLGWYSAIGAFLFAGLGFLIAGAVVNRLLPEPGVRRTVAVSVVYALTEVMRTTTVGIALQRYGLEFDLMLHHRIVSGGLTGLLVLGVVSIAVNDRANFVAQFQLLADRTRALETELDHFTTKIDAFIHTLRETVRQTVDTAFTPIFDRYRARQSVTDVVNDIVELSENVVRPLSTDIAAALPERIDDTSQPPRIALPRLFHLVTTEKPFEPLGIGVVFFLLLFGASIFMLPFPTGLIFLAVSIALTSATHLL